MTSPSGEYQVVVSVNNNNKQYRDYAKIIFHLLDKKGKELAVYDPRSNDFMKWAVGWMPKQDTLILFSSDIGTYGYTIQNDSFVKLNNINKKMCNRAIELYQIKYSEKAPATSIKFCEKQKNIKLRTTYDETKLSDFILNKKETPKGLSLSIFNPSSVNPCKFRSNPQLALDAYFTSCYAVLLVAALTDYKFPKQFYDNDGEFLYAKFFKVSINQESAGVDSELLHNTINIKAALKIQYSTTGKKSDEIGVAAFEFDSQSDAHDYFGFFSSLNKSDFQLIHKNQYFILLARNNADKGLFDSIVQAYKNILNR